MFYLGEYIVVEELQNECYYNTEDGGDKCHFHAFCNDGWTDVACRLDAVECYYHAYYGSEKSQRRCGGDKELNPRTPLFHIANLYRTVIGELTVYLVEWFFLME